MSENTGRIFTVIGIVTVVYFFLVYILPPLVRLVGTILKFVIIAGFVGICAVIIVYIIGKIVQSLRDRG